MPVVRGYVNGVTAGHAGPGSRADQRRPRSAIQGWSRGAVRRHQRWLFSVDPDLLELPGLVGVSITLTVRDCPADAAAWAALRKGWVEALERWGAVRVHWVTEWQRRGVPHLHAFVYFDTADERFPGDPEALPLLAWLLRTGHLRAEASAQHVQASTGPLGWLKYLSKHAARGVAHYQRQGMPEGWEKSGRLWGHRGDWPVVEPIRADLTWPQYWTLRRRAKGWRLAEAQKALREATTPDRARQARRRISYARRMFQVPDRALSSTRGISEWIPQDALLRMLPTG